MKLLSPAVISLLLIGMVIAGGTRLSAAMPQPRPRLDPARQAAVTTPAPKEEKKTEAEAPVMMDRLVVKEHGSIPTHPPAVEDPTGEFSPLKGGRTLRRDVGNLRIEAGIWPHIELFEDEARFKPTKTRVDLDFLRIKF